MSSQEVKKIIVIVGPTASGKSSLAVRIAKNFKGEIISADSRQVYRGMDIGTGKITKKEMDGVPHYLLNVVSPKRRFTAGQYRKMAITAINKIFKKKGLPIICGGTGFYIQAVVDGITIPEIPPDWKLRKKLGKKSVNTLYQMVKKIDPRRAKTIERKNPRRLIRAIEIVLKTKRPIPPLKKNPLPYPVLIIGIKKPFPELKKLIKKRFLKWLKMGLIAEVKKLRKSGLSWKRIEEFGMEYLWVAKYLQGKLNRDEMIKFSQKEIEKYAKRQITWFKKYPAPESSVRYGASKRIHWVKNFKESEKLVKNFLQKTN